MSDPTVSSPVARPRLLSISVALALGLLALALFVGAGRGAPFAGKALAAEELAATNWTLVSPLGWTGRPTVIRVTASDPLGLQEATAQYRYSINGGASWSLWSADGALQRSAPNPNTVYFTLTLNSLVESSTLNRVQFALLDQTGITQTSPIYTIQVDATAPLAPINLSANPAGWTAINNFTLTWTNPPQSDAAPISKAYFKFDAPPSGPGDSSGFRSGINIFQIAGLTVPHNGQVPCYVWIEDQAGNSDYRNYAMVTLYYSGGVAPDRPGFMQIFPSGWTNNCQFTVTWVNPPAPAGIYAAWYKWGSPPTANGDGTRVPGVGINRLENLTPPGGPGVQTIYVWLEDGAGSQDYTHYSYIDARCDTTPPTTNYTVAPLPVGGWFSTTVTVNLVAVDGLSGVCQTRYRRQGLLWRDYTGPFTVTESSTYEYYAVDCAGNRELTKTLTIQIDRDPPTSTATPSAPLPPSGWYTQPVTITIAATDAGSGWAGQSQYRLDGGPILQGTSVLISSDSCHTLEYRSRDVVGNWEAWKTATYCLDRAAPTVTPTVTAARVSQDGQWYKPPVTITLQATDPAPGSGVQVVQYRRQGTVPWSEGNVIRENGAQGDGPYTYEYRARDVAGNVSAVQTITVQIDDSAPGQPGNVAVSPTAWVNTDGLFRVDWTNPADLSGIWSACYQLDLDPCSQGTSGARCVVGQGIQSISNISVGSAGAHRVYVWLRDGVGNSDPCMRGTPITFTLRYDNVPPTYDPPRIQGPKKNDSEWYTGPVTITLAGRDAHSGVAALCYQVEGSEVVCLNVPRQANGIDGPLTAERSFTLSYEGARKTVEYWTRDVAGNESARGRFTLYFDALAPASPTGITANPAGWSNTNNFTICWTNPEDYSGVAAVWYKKGSAPTHAADGQRLALATGQKCLPGLTVAEGATPVYIWLEDRAGNADYRRAVSIPLHYDATPPQTELVIVSGNKGCNDYYVTPVTLRFTASDQHAGVARTLYRINEGAWQVWDGNPITLAQEGALRVDYYSQDNAANQEAEHRSPVFKLDLVAPIAVLRPQADYSASGSVYLTWQGYDSASGSGVASYTIEYRRGGCSAWLPWLTDTASTGGTFANMSFNSFYYFRIKATDKACNVSTRWWPSERGVAVYVEGLVNGFFDTGRLDPWASSGTLTTQAVYSQTRTGGWSYMAQLSKRWPLNDVPVNGEAVLYQVVTLPSLDCDQGLALSFWYRIFSYDLAWGKPYGSATPTWLDTFEVWVQDRNGVDLGRLLLDGNFDPGPINTSNPKLFDLGWKHFSADLTPWAGQQVRLVFKVFNRWDKWYPTWVYLDDVRLLPSAGRSVFLPLIRGSGEARPGAPAPTQSLPNPEEPADPTQPPRRR